jgi:hypothetical protein
MSARATPLPMYSIAQRCRNGEPAPLQVQGLSVTLGAATCTTTVTFIVTEP